MKYRCPHCGEPGFSVMKKLIFPIRRLFYHPKCDYCNNETDIYMWWRGKVIFSGTVEMLFFIAYAGVMVGLLTAAPPEQNNSSDVWLHLKFFWAPLLVWGLTVLLFRWFFCSFDKLYREDTSSADKFRFTIPATVWLWPRVRVGEIYLFRFPKRQKREDGPYLIGMVTRVEKNGESKEVTVRVVKEYLMDAPMAEEEILLTTEGAFCVEGVVSHTYRLPPQEE